MGDMLEEAIASEGANTGREGMLKPADIIAQEKGETAKPAAAPAKEEPGKKEEPIKEAKKEEGAVDLEAQYDAILEKIEKGEELTTEEKLLVSILEKDVKENPPPADEGKKYTIDGKEFTETELEAQMRDEFGVGDLKLNDKARGQLLEAYYKTRNRTAFTKANNDRAQLNAQDRAENERVKQENQRKQNTLLAEARAIEMRAQDVAQREQALVRLVAAGGIDKSELTDPSTGQVDPEKLEKYLDFKRAQSALEQIKTEKQTIEAAQADNAAQAFAVEVRTFLAEHQQYATASGDPFEVFERLRRGDSVPQEDKMKILELDRLAKECRMNGISLEDQYAYNQQAGTLAIKASAQSGSGSKLKRPPLPELTEKTPKTVREVILAYKKRQTAAAAGGATGGAGGGGERGVGKTTARQTIERDQKLLREEKDPFLTVLGFK